MMYENKYNMCTGYFPEFILDPYLDNFNFNNDNDVLTNGSPNLSNDINNYYPHFKDGKYSKQISNANSKYNNSYFLKMKPIYKICKKFWEPFHNYESLNSKPYDLKSYDQKLHKKTKSQSLNPTGYERVVKSSERGTLGEDKSVKKNHMMQNILTKNLIIKNC